MRRGPAWARLERRIRKAHTRPKRKFLTRLRAANIARSRRVRKRASVYARDDGLFFCSMSSLHGGGSVCWPLFFKIAVNASSREKGEAVLKALAQSVYATAELDAYFKEHRSRLGDEWLPLAKVPTRASFYKDARRCRVESDSHIVSIMPVVKRGSMEFVSINADDVANAPAKDPEAIGRALEEALGRCRLGET